MTCAEQQQQGYDELIAILQGALKDNNQLTTMECKVAYDAYLTPRTNVELAVGLGVSVNTVKTHLRHIYKKLNVGSRLEFKHQLDDLFMT